MTLYSYFSIVVVKEDTQEFHEKNFVDVIYMSNYQEWMESDAFLAVVADSISNYPSIQEEFNRIYSGDKYRYYEAARNSDSYSELSMPRGRLTLEVAAKRNLGILLVARYDEKVYQVIRPILLEIHPAIKGYISAPHKNTNYERTAFECIGNARLGIHKSISLLMVSGADGRH